MSSQSDLDVFFKPRGVAVIGASRDEHKLGYGVLHNLLQHGYQGPVYPVNPKADEILGRPCYSDIRRVPDPVDLAVIILPASIALEVVDDCGRRGLRGVIVVSGGFREIGPEGAARETKLVQTIQRYGMRLIGPNAVGVMDTITRLNTTFIAGMPPRGDIAFVSQSGAICGGIVDWARMEGIGFSRFISLGNQANVTQTDMLAFLEKDPHTEVIAIYLEGITDGRSFMEVARRVSRKKPILALKVGTTDAGARAAISHTGALAGAAHIYRAAFDQCGILRAESVECLFDWARAFSAYHALSGDDIAIITNAGGPAVVAADGLERVGLRLTELQAKTRDRLKSTLVPYAQVNNPVDMLGGADGATYRRVTSTVLADANVDGVIVIHVPQAVVPPEEVAQAIGKATSEQPNAKPVLASCMGGIAVQSARTALRTRGIPDYHCPERATRAMGALAQRHRWLSCLRKAPPMSTDVDTARVRRHLEEARTQGQKILTDLRAFDIIDAYQIPVAQTRLARTPHEAIRQADAIGYPVVLKAVAPTVVHKTEVNGVALDIMDRHAVADTFRRLTNNMSPAPNGILVQEMVLDGWEVIVGFTHDPQFGPVVMYGLGGIYVEVLEDVSFRVVPLTEADAWEMIDGTRSVRLLRGVRGRPAANIQAIVSCLLRLSQLAMDCPEIQELDINPLIVNERRAVAVDVRLTLEEG